MTYQIILKNPSTTSLMNICRRSGPSLLQGAFTSQSDLRFRDKSVSPNNNESAKQSDITEIKRAAWMNKLQNHTKHQIISQNFQKNTYKLAKHAVEVRKPGIGNLMMFNTTV